MKKMHLGYDILVTGTKSVSLDIANPEALLLITKESSKESELANEMVTEFDKLEKSRPPFPLETTLRHLLLSANLTIYFYHVTSPDNEMFYWEKMQHDYDVLCQHPTLMPSQKAQWSSLVGDVFHIIRYWDAAINCYQQALHFEKTTYTSQKNAAYLHHGITLIKCYLDYALSCQKQPAPDLVIKQCDDALHLAGEMLALTKEQFLHAKIYFYQGQANYLLAKVYYEKKEIENAWRYSLDGIIADMSGLATSPPLKENQDKFQARLESSQKLCLHLTSSENCNSKIQAYINKHKASLTNKMQQLTTLNVNLPEAVMISVKENIKKINDYFDSVINKKKESFWKTSSSTQEAEAPALIKSFSS